MGAWCSACAAAAWSLTLVRPFPSESAENLSRRNFYTQDFFAIPHIMESAIFAVPRPLRGGARFCGAARRGSLRSPFAARTETGCVGCFLWIGFPGHEEVGRQAGFLGSFRRNDLRVSDRSRNDQQA